MTATTEELTRARAHHHLTWRFRVFYFLLFVPVGMQTPYTYLFLRRQGLTNGDVGSLAALVAVVSFVSPPLWGVVADRLGDRRRVLALLLLISGLAYPLLILAHSFRVAAGVLVVFACFNRAPISIIDAIALDNLGRAGGDYGRLRLWGSIGFAVPLLIFGCVLQSGAARSAAGLYPTFLGFLGFRLLSVLWISLLPASRDGRRPLGSDLRAVLTPAFFAVALCGALQVAAMSAYYVYLTIYLDHLGVPDNLKGYFWVIAVAAETCMMLVIGRVIARIGLKWTFSLSLLGAAVRLFALSFEPPAAVVVGLQLLHALTLAAFTVPAVMFVSRLVPSRLRASGQTAWLAATSGLGAGVGSQLAGRAAEAWGLAGLFRAFSALAAVGFVLVVLLVREPAAADEEAEGREIADARR